MTKNIQVLLIGMVTLILPESVNSQHSVARQWNEVLLEAIRGDFARPTVHARNLFHTSIAMYDAWAAFDDTAEPYLLGKTLGEFHCPFEGVKITPADVESLRREAISYACFRLLNHRFKNSPGAASSLPRFRNLMIYLGYDPNLTTLDYRNSAAGLGNYIAEFLINYGFQDGSNEEGEYENLFYLPVNRALPPGSAGNPTIDDPNRWQPLEFTNFIDQSGNVTPHAVPAFLSPEWGQVHPFALKEENKTIYLKDGHEYQVYHDPGPPPLLGQSEESTDAYKWGFSLVAVWSSHLDPQDETLWDISPSSMGNINISSLPTSPSRYYEFFNYLEGGYLGEGYPLNPKTGQAYEPQIVKRGDFTRTLAEFWADGPDSETPPGHWFTILNYVNDHPEFKKKFNGEGKELNDLEWDVKSYFVMGGAMHDAAIAAWGIKGYYDFIRPVSAIRYMADKGQGTDVNLPNYNKDGIPLIPGYIELVTQNDPLAGVQGENLNKIKIYGWKGPDYIEDPASDAAGVDWILAENWWPYQRPTFITPPFAGFISGHSTFSRAAAEVMTLITGDPFFPGGMGEFIVPKNEFLVFEEGPTEEVVLQWATYRDASDQCSLSRIWGGIHPPADDLPGRRIGAKIGADAFKMAEEYFSAQVNPAEDQLKTYVTIYPNPVDNVLNIRIEETSSQMLLELIDIHGKIINSQMITDLNPEEAFPFHIGFLPRGFYLLRLTTEKGESVHRVIKQ